mgnify:CR=1 FL=1
MKKFLFILSTVLITISAQSAAQVVTISASNEIVCEGNTVTVNIFVNNFTNVSAMSFPVAWDTDVLSYVSSQVQAPPLIPIFGVNAGNAASGNLVFSWIDPAAPFNFSLPNGAVILTVTFTAVGDYAPDPDFFSSISLQSLPGFPAEVYQNGNITPSMSNFANGSVTIADNQIPSISGCPIVPPVMVPFGSPGTNVSWTPPTATDNCDLTSTLIPSHAPGSFFSVGTTTVTYIAQDDAGNSSLPCTFDVVVEEGPAPGAYTFVASDEMLSCNDTTVAVTLSVENFIDVEGFQFAFTWDPTILAFDSLVNASFPVTNGALGNNQAGVASGLLLVNWVDFTSQGIDFPNGEELMTIYFGVDTAALNAAGFTLAEFTSLGFFPIIITTDGSGPVPPGNISLLQSTITFNDAPPVIVGCPTSVTQNNTPGQCGRVVSWTAPTATDDCDNPAPVPVLTEGLAPGSFFQVGKDTIVYIATDSKGQKDTCSFVIEILDNEFPVPNIATLPTITAECSVTVTPPTATDNCAGVITGTTANPLTYTTQGSFTIIWSYNDGNGNVTTQTQTVIVDDVTAPVPDVATLPTVTGECSATVAAAPTATDNCAGVITGTTTDPLIYTTQGTFTITWTFNDGNGNVSTQTQTVIVDDVTAPVPDVATLPTVTGECSATVAAAPTATDNCAGAVTGTTTDPLTYSTQGTFTITWTYNDGNGNVSTQTQTVIVDDVTAPVPNVAVLPAITAECSVTLTAPTATDNCAGTVTATTTDPVTYNTEGTYTVTWTYNDGNGNSTTQTQTVTVDDVTAPVPNVAVLPVITGECSATVASAPTATDNCEGVIVATTTDPLIYNTQGTFTITWIYNDGNGNISNQTQTVIVDDVTAPVPNVAVLPAATGECSVTVATAPTATDNCAGIITGTTTDPLTYNTQGTFTITWTYNDGNGNVSTQTRTVIVDDVTAPVPNVAVLPVVTGECSATVASAPTATDNCAGGIIATTTDPLTYNTQGTFTITWSYNDGNGNISTQTQTVVVDDVTAPVPNVATLPTVTGECSATVTVAPTATDNCAGVITGTTTDPLTYNTQGTFTITWTYNDGNGNVSTQTQTVIVDDITAPVPNVASLPNVTGECSVTVTPPTATDNCSGAITGSTTDPLTYNVAGTYTVTWNYDDGNGNVSTQTQTVIVNDITAPVPDVASLPDVTGECSVTVTPPTATDNCAGVITGTTTDPLTYSTQDTFTITWTYDDGNGNVITQTQTVIVDDITAPVPNVASLPDVTGECSVTVTPPTATDNCAGVITGTTTDPLTYTVQDTFIITWTYDDGNGNVSTQTQTVIVDDITAPVPNVANLPNATGDCSVTVTPPTATDNCAGAITGTTADPLTYSTQGTFTITWTYNDGNGNTGTQTQTIIVDDNQAPVLECIADISIEIPAGTAPVQVNDIYLFSIFENCTLDTSYYLFTGATTGGGSGLDASGSSFEVGVTTVTYYAVDEAGNTGSCTFDISVEEEAVFMLVCPSDTLVQTDNGDCGAVVNNLTPIVNPAASLAALLFEATGATTAGGSGDVSGLTFVVGNSTVTYFAISTNNDTLSCSFDVEVDDTEAPVFVSCWNDTIIGNSLTKCGLLFDGVALPEAVDNCPGVTVVYNFAVGSLIPLGGPYNITAQATDTSGNTAICTYNVVIIDSEGPAITGCPTDFTVPNDPGLCGAAVTWTEPTATDNCQLIAFTPSLVPNSFIPVTVTGTYPIEYVAVDATGNISKCVFNVTVTDTEPPVFQSCPGNITVNTASNQCSAVVTWPQPTATDNCGVTGFSSTVTSGTTFQVGTNTVTYTAVDAAGNVKTCSFSVTVIDNQPPTIVNIPADITAYATANSCGAVVNWPTPVFSDNCGLDSIGTSVSSGSFFEVTTLGFPHEVEVFATDIHGNTVVESFNVTVLDTIAPAIVCPGNIVVSANGLDVSDPSGFLTAFQPIDCENVTLNFSNVPASDACGVFAVTQTTGTLPGSIFPVGTSFITFQAEDEHGNQSSCSFTIEVTGLPMPAAFVSDPAACIGDEVVFSVTEMPGAVYVWVDEQGFPISFESSFTLSNVSLSDAGTYTAFVGYPACDLPVTVVLDVAGYPEIEANANDLLCTDGSAPLVLLGSDIANAGVTDWIWEHLPSGSIYVGQNVSVPNATASNSGLYVLTGINANGCAGTDTIQVSISNDVLVMPSLFGTSSAKCINQEITLNGQTFNGNNVTYHWYAEPSGGNGLTSINNHIVTVKPTQAGDFFYYYYVVVDGCSSDTAQWYVTVEQPPVIAFTIDGDTTCVDGTTSVTLTETGGEATSWQWKKGNSILVNTQTLVLQNVTAATSGDYVVVATTDNGCTSTQQYTLNITDQPDVTVELFASTDKLCKDASVTLTATPVQGATYIWSGPNLPPLAQFNSTITVQPGQTGTFNYTFAALIGQCTTNVASVAVEVVTDALPAITAYLEAAACEDEDLRFCVDLVPGAIYEWRRPNGSVFANVQCPVIPNAMQGMNGVYSVTASKDGCSSTDTLLVTLPKPPLAVDEVVVGLVDTPKSFNVVVNDSLYGKNYTITLIQEPAHGDVVYDGQGVFTYTPDPGFRETDRIIYEVCYEDCPGTCDIGLVTIIVRYEIDTCIVTTVITPNEDGINDELVVSCLEFEERPLNKIMIFNQWGDLVYEAAPYKNDWKGTYENKNLPDGTYFYIFQPDPDLPAQKGFVMIYR